MILLSARFRRFCHPQFRLAIDYTACHQDDQGEFCRSAWQSCRPSAVLRIGDRPTQRTEVRLRQASRESRRPCPRPSLDPVARSHPALCARPGQDPDFWFPANGTDPISEVDRRAAAYLAQLTAPADPATTEAFRCRQGRPGGQSLRTMPARTGRGGSWVLLMLSRYLHELCCRCARLAAWLPGPGRAGWP